jgi:hypothetical protein
MRARSWAQSMRLGMRLDRKRGAAATGPGGGGFWAWPGGATETKAGPGAGGDSASVGDSSGGGRPMETTVDLSRALGARTPW